MLTDKKMVNVTENALNCGVKCVFTVFLKHLLQATEIRDCMEIL